MKFRISIHIVKKPLACIPLKRIIPGCLLRQVDLAISSKDLFVGSRVDILLPPVPLLQILYSRLRARISQKIIEMSEFMHEQKMYKLLPIDRKTPGQVKNILPLQHLHQVKGSFHSISSVIENLRNLHIAVKAKILFIFLP